MAAAAARATPLDAGSMSAGLTLGGSTRSVTVGGSFGYFVARGVRADALFRYTYVDHAPGVSHTVAPGVGLRVYPLPRSPVTPLVFVELAYVHLTFEGTPLEGQYDMATLAPGGGLLVRVGRHAGFELTAAAVVYLGTPRALADAGVVPDSVGLRWGGGFVTWF